MWVSNSMEKFKIMKLANHAVLKLLILFAVLISGITVAQAAYQRSYLNFDFESTPLGTACYVQVDAANVPGWNTTHRSMQGSGGCGSTTAQFGKLIELWSHGFSNIPARQGNVFAELNAEEYSEMQQNVCLIQGEPVTWKLSHNGRGAIDKMSLRAGAQTIVSVATSQNGAGTILSCASGNCNVSSGVVPYNGNKFWADYNGTFNYTGTTGQTVLGFKADTGSSGSLGNFLDAIQISVKPIIEFASANYNIPENGTPQDIKVIIVGVIPTGGLNLTFNVNDGTPPKNAEINLDYKINGSTNKTFTKTIPAGDYGMGTPYTLSIPVEILNDNVKEEDEQFTVTIQRDDSNFYLYSSSVCGSAGNGTTTYTILDDDAPTQMNVAIAKSQRAGTSGIFSSDPLTVGTNGTVQYRLVMTNLGENPISQTALATFTDTLPANFSSAPISVVSTISSTSGENCSATKSSNTISGTFSGAKNTTCTVIIQATAPSTGVILTNTASTNVPIGNTDIDTSNNSSSVQTTVAAATLILNKETTSGIGTFSYSLTNTLQSSATVAVDMPGSSTQVDSDTTKSGVQPFIISSINNVVITETMPTGQRWELSTATCKNAAGTTITSSISGNALTINSSGITAGAVITCNLMNTRLPTVKVQKISYGGTGTFSFSKTNLTETLNNISTSSAGIPAPANPTALSVTVKGTNVTITESSPPTNYVLTEASCRDDNSLVTGNTGTFGSLVNSSRVLTIPSTYLVTGGADITCTFVNRLNPQTDLNITKTNNETALLRGQSTSYLVRVTNKGSTPVMGATLADAVGTNQTKTSVTCSNANNNKCTPSSTPTTSQIESGYALPKLDTDEFYEVIVTATISSSSISTTKNTASVAAPSGVTNSGVSCTASNSGGVVRSYNTSTGVCSVADTDTVSVAGPTLTVQKTWVNAKQYDKATITADTTTGLAKLESIATGVASQTDSSSILIANNTSVTLKEVIDIGDGNYTVATPTCSAGTVTNNNDGTYNLAIPSSGTTGITCTYTNTRKTATLKLTKTWTNAKTGDVVAIPATLGLAVNTNKFKSTAPTSSDSGTAITVYAGDTITLGAEIGLNDYASGDPNYDATVTMNKDNYDATLSCTASGGATANLLSGTNAKQSNTLTIGASDMGKLITCTYNNSRIPQQIRLVKEWKNAVINDQIKVVTTGGTNNPGMVSISSGNNIESGGVVTVYSGDVISLPAESFISGNASQYTITTACNGGTPLNDGLVGRTITVSNNTVITVCTYKNTRTALDVIVSGKVFTDNSGTTGDVSKAYNAVQDTGEIEIANSKISLTNCSSTSLATTATNASGEYRFSIDQSQLPATFCIVQTNLPEYTSVSGSSPTGTYNRNTDTVTLAKTAAVSYPNNNFGDANLNVLFTEDGQHTAVAGDVTEYPHRLVAQSPVQLTQLNQVLSQQPNSSNDQQWQALVYRDTNCNGNVDAGETLFNPSVASSVLLQPNADICLVQRVHVPTNAVAGAQHIGTLQANYQFALTNPVETLSKQTAKRQDMTLIGSAGLTLTKKVRAVASCPSSAADQNAFSVNNQARKQDNLEYEIIYKNNSTKKLQNVKIKDSLPTGTNLGSISCVSTPSGNTCSTNSSGSSLQWNLTGMLNPAAAGSLRFCVTQ